MLASQYCEIGDRGQTSHPCAPVVHTTQPRASRRFINPIISITHRHLPLPNSNSSFEPPRHRRIGTTKSNSTRPFGRRKNLACPFVVSCRYDRVRCVSGTCPSCPSGHRFISSHPIYRCSPHRIHSHFVRRAFVVVVSVCLSVAAAAAALLNLWYISL